MRRWFALLILLFSLSMPAQVQAAPPAKSDIALQSLEIDVWPEYDRPGVLVIYRITLSPQVKLPAEINLKVPVTAGNPSAVAEQTANGLFNLQFSEAGRDSQWITIRFTTTLPQVQIEYYDALKKDGVNRAYTLRWPGDYAVADLLVKVQQPRTASGLTLAPNTGSAITGQDGLTYFNVPLGNVDAGASFELNIQYQKNDDQLTQTSSFEQVTPVNPANPNVAPAFPQSLPWILGGLGLVLIGGGIFWYLRGLQPASPIPGRARHRGAPAETAPPGDAVFCHQCGKKAAAGDIFCRACGTRLRR